MTIAEEPEKIVVKKHHLLSHYKNQVIVEEPEEIQAPHLESKEKQLITDGSDAKYDTSLLFTNLVAVSKDD